MTLNRIPREDMRPHFAHCLTLALTAACGATGHARVAAVPRAAACPPIGVETDTAGVAGQFYTEGRVGTEAVPIYETRRTAVRGPRHPGVNGEAFVAFVVDTSGRVDMTTFTVQISTAAEITKAVRDFLPSQRFTPALIDGCTVRQLVFMPFVFSGNR